MLNRTTLRRLGAAAIAPALAAGMVLAAPSAQADPNSAETSATEWLADQPKVDGLFRSYYGPTRAESFVDYGLNLDLYVALDTFGSPAAETVYRSAVDGADEYTDAFGTRYAGATGKLTAMVQRHEGDPTNVDGRDLVADLEQLVSGVGATTGRAQDRDLSSGEVSGYESSNSIGQSWVVRALDNAASPKTADALAYLLKQQCANGSFRLVMNDTQCVTGKASVDATAFAVQALDVASGHDAEVEKAVTWLVGAQSPNGAFIDEGQANSNSTGVASVVLKTHGKEAAASRAAGWVLGRQVATGDERGAIATNDADYSAGAKPITRLDRDRYVRSTVQAVLALKALDPAASFVVKASGGFISAGKNIAVTATGLAPNEAFTVLIAGGAPKYGTANAAGQVSTTVTAVGATGTKTITLEGTNKTRAGRTAVQVLAAKKLSVALTSTVKKNKKQTVKASGLAAGETVKIYVAGKLVKTSKANASGKYNYSFKVGKKAGKKTVKVVGAFTNRNGSKSFKVK